MPLSPNGPDRHIATEVDDEACMACTNPKRFLAMATGEVWELCRMHMGLMKFYLRETFNEPYREESLDGPS